VRVGCAKPRNFYEVLITFSVIKTRRFYNVHNLLNHGIRESRQK